MKIKLCAAVMALFVLCPDAIAEVYVSGSLTKSNYQYEDVNGGTGNQFALGYRFVTSNDLPFLVEIGHVDLGAAKVNDFSTSGINFTNTELGWSGNVLSAGMFLGELDDSIFTFKVGYYTGDSTLQGRANGSPYSFEEKSDGICWGLGGEWRFSKYVGLVIDIDGMSSVKTLPEISEEDSTVTVFTVGLAGHFVTGK